MIIKEEVGTACYESWSVGARMAIERLEAENNKIIISIAKIEISAEDDADFRNQVVDYFTKCQPKISPHALPSQAYDQHFTPPELNDFLV